MMYKSVSKDMYKRQSLKIWDYNYPCGYLKNDVLQKRLYGLFRNGEIIGAYALCLRDSTCDIKWSDKKSIFCERIAVDIRYRMKGIGTMLCDSAKIVAASEGYESIRALVIDKNEPSIKMFEKSGFIRLPGFTSYKADSGSIFLEYGFECLL